MARTEAGERSPPNTSAKVVPIGVASSPRRPRKASDMDGPGGQRAGTQWLISSSNCLRMNAARPLAWLLHHPADQCTCWTKTFGWSGFLKFSSKRHSPLTLYSRADRRSPRRTRSSGVSRGRRVKKETPQEINSESVIGRAECVELGGSIHSPRPILSTILHCWGLIS